MLDILIRYWRIEPPSPNDFGSIPPNFEALRNFEPPPLSN